MINQIVSLWAHHCKPKWHENLSEMVNILLVLMSIVSIMFLEKIVSSSFKIKRSKDVDYDLMITLAMMALGTRAVTEFYFITARAIEQRTHRAVSQLLSCADIQCDPPISSVFSPNTPPPGEQLLQQMEKQVAESPANFFGSIVGFIVGYAAWYVFSSYCLPKNIKLSDLIFLYSLYVPAVLTGGIPGFVLGATIGRLIEDASDIQDNWKCTRQEIESIEAVMILNEKAKYPKQHLPLGILGLIRNYSCGDAVKQLGGQELLKIIKQENAKEANKKRLKYYLPFITFFSSKNQSAHVDTVDSSVKSKLN